MFTCATCYTGYTCKHLIGKVNNLMMAKKVAETCSFLLIITPFTKTSCVRRLYNPILIMKNTTGMNECKILVYPTLYTVHCTIVLRWNLKSCTGPYDCYTLLGWSHLLILKYMTIAISLCVNILYFKKIINIFESLAYEVDMHVYSLFFMY
jgi:hypothetical protein